MAILQEILEFSPKHDLREMLGKEKDRIVRHLVLLATERERGEAGWPGTIMQLDIIAERILRVAYLRFGQSHSLKQEIESSPSTPDYGALLGALQSVRELRNIQARLQTLHDLRSKKTEFAHIGEQPTEDDARTASNFFGESARTMIGALDKD